ncbi:Bud-site selection protein, BUD22 [Lasallia pustulata]|uniref:Bud-site selection protein, BUD22 n=1 Tax=Lasallia pustulata TaxID=136370 RepID=A0A1W5CSK2_9LECA|nr:Bud-site selection protein, BUD22 [Lasallia pustulata]
MPKRKRFEISTAVDPVDESLDRSVRSQRQQLETFIEYGKKNLFRSLKVARGFERQKLGRRQKTAKEKHDDAEIARLEAEVAALKALDLATTAQLHLHKTLLKSKPIATSAALPPSVASILDSATQSHDIAHANVTARLYNSNPVKSAMTEVMASINAVLGLEQQPNRKKRLRKADYKSDKAMKVKLPRQKEDIRRIEDVTNDGSDSVWDIIPRPGVPHEATNADGDEDEGVNKDEGEDAEESELEDVTYASRLANSSDSESADDKSEDDPETTPITGAERIARALSLSPFPSDPTPSPSPPPSKAKPTKTSTITPKSTTFLPSLMMGGYWSGSESASDIDDDEADAADNQPRKNRMGQQARRVLWEKKFGAKANHLKDQKRDVDWDSRKGARGGDERGKRERGRGGRRDGGGGREFVSRGRGASGASGANSEIVGGRKTKMEEGPLHPSWEAAKKAKEQKKTATFQGKKVVFD